MSLATGINRLTSFTIALAFLTLQALNPAALFFSLGFIAMYAGVFVYYYLPETKGKTLEEITDAFTQGYAQIE